MNKKLILFFAIAFSIIGSYVPVFFGSGGLLGGWEILSGLIGGFVGIWLGVAVSKRWG